MPGGSHTTVSASTPKPSTNSVSAVGEPSRPCSRPRIAGVSEKDAIARIRKQKEEIDRLKTEEQRYERAGDLSRVAEIRYGKLAAAEKELQSAQDKLAELQQEHPMLKEEVGEEEIAKIVF